MKEFNQILFVIASFFLMAFVILTDKPILNLKAKAVTGEVTTEAFYKPTPEIQLIFEKLKAQLGSKGADASLWVSTTTTINAYSDWQDRVVLQYGLLKFNNQNGHNLGQLAGIIAHELGHVYYGHPKGHYDYGKTAEHTRNAERQADNIAVKFLADAGYDCHGGADFLKTIVIAFGPSTGNGEDHPGDIERIFDINRTCDIYLQTGDLIPPRQEAIEYRVPVVINDHNWENESN